MADVAYPVVSLGKMIESGFTFSFDGDYKCHTHKGNQCGDLSKRSNLRVENEETEVDDDGGGAGDARAEPRADEPGDDPPPPRPREVRPSPIRPGAEAVRQHNLTLWSTSELVRNVCGIEKQE